MPPPVTPHIHKPYLLSLWVPPPLLSLGPLSSGWWRYLHHLMRWWRYLHHPGDEHIVIMSSSLQQIQKSTKQLFYIIHTTTAEIQIQKKCYQLTTTALTNLLMLIRHSALQYKEQGNFKLKHFTHYTTQQHMSTNTNTLIDLHARFWQGIYNDNHIIIHQLKHYFLDNHMRNSHINIKTLQHNTTKASV